ncbi:hypothetical protein IGB42_04138 [Andreprevotia sp. IGB-42]|uniref:replication protein n=1 Tax=Andreprevotia sp. IGB-42 TaxID=2497473 RepID=UPI00135B26F6|nr:replication protein [Andreprevotia sp. IGB-42]KAF0811372.1 hypothetical protein IGB42_04138 [Andreprevotia sp. IGB-42]
MNAIPRLAATAVLNPMLAGPLPQWQAGFVAIPNGVMDALLAAGLAGRQLKLALAITRKTYGFCKETDDITITQLAALAGIHRPDASKVFQSLLDMHIITARKGRFGYLVGFNAPADWRLAGLANAAVAGTTAVAKPDSQVLQSATHNKQSQQTIEEANASLATAAAAMQPAPDETGATSQHGVDASTSLPAGDAPGEGDASADAALDALLDAMADTASTPRSGKAARLRIAAPAHASCPQREIIALYHELLPACPQVLVWHQVRARLLRARWNENLKAGRYSGKADGLRFWRRYFGYVAQSAFLVGNSNSVAGKPPFMADLEWLLRPGNFAKVVEGRYHGGAQ